MSIVEKRTTQKITGDSLQLLTPEEVLEQLRALSQRIPLYGPLSSKDVQSINRVAHVDRQFVEATINTLGASAAMQNALGVDADELRADLDLAARWGAVEDELLKLLKGVRSGNLTRRHHLGMAALQTYRISQQLARSSDHTELLPHIETMRRLNKFGRVRRKPFEPAPPAAAE